MDCKNTISSTTIQDLNHDCLIFIFSMLPVIDQIKIQRVCKRWRLFSRIALNGLKRFEVYNKKFWGIGEESKVRINRDIFKNILKLYGLKITHIDLTYDYGDERENEPAYYRLDKNINMFPDKKVIQCIFECCPNVISFNVGQRCEQESLQYIAENFRNLIYFTYMTESYGDSEVNLGDELSRLFSNNRNLKRLRLKYPDFPVTCLSHLNPESIKEIYLCDVWCLEIEPIRVFWYFQKIHTMTVIQHFDEYIEIAEKLRFIGLHLQNLRKLRLNFFSFNRGDKLNSHALLREYDFIITLTDLEELHIDEEPLANDDFMQIICNNCKKLKTLKIEKSDGITDEGMSKIKLLPNLQNLYIKKTEVTGSFLMSEVPKLKNLVFDHCGSLQNEGIIFLLLSSQYIENLEITSRLCLNGTDLINRIIRNIKDRKFKKVQLKISVEVKADECEYTCIEGISIEILEISSEYYTRASQKLCKVCCIRKENFWEPRKPCKNCLTTTFIHKISKD